MTTTQPLTAKNSSLNKVIGNDMGNNIDWGHYSSNLTNYYKDIFTALNNSGDFENKLNSIPVHPNPKDKTKTLYQNALALFPDPANMIKDTAYDLNHKIDIGNIKISTDNPPVGRVYTASRQYKVTVNTTIDSFSRAVNQIYNAYSADAKSLEASIYTKDWDDSNMKYLPQFVAIFGSVPRANLRNCRIVAGVTDDPLDMNNIPTNFGPNANPDIACLVAEFFLDNPRVAYSRCDPTATNLNTCAKLVELCKMPGGFDIRFPTAAIIAIAYEKANYDKPTLRDKRFGLNTACANPAFWDNSISAAPCRARCLNNLSDAKSCGLDKYCTFDKLGRKVCLDYCSSDKTGFPCESILETYCDNIDNINSEQCKRFCTRHPAKCKSRLQKYCSENITDPRCLDFCGMKWTTKGADGVFTEETNQQQCDDAARAYCNNVKKYLADKGLVYPLDYDKMSPADKKMCDFCSCLLSPLGEYGQVACIDTKCQASGYQTQGMRQLATTAGNCASCLQVVSGSGKYWEINGVTQQMSCTPNSSNGQGVVFKPVTPSQDLIARAMIKWRQPAKLNNTDIVVHVPDSFIDRLRDIIFLSSTTTNPDTFKSLTPEQRVSEWIKVVNAIAEFHINANGNIKPFSGEDANTMAQFLNTTLPHLLIYLKSQYSDSSASSFNVFQTNNTEYTSNGKALTRVLVLVVAESVAYDASVAATLNKTPVSLPSPAPSIVASTTIPQTSIVNPDESNDLSQKVNIEGANNSNSTNGGANTPAPPAPSAPSTSGQHVGDGNNLTPIDINKPSIPADIAGGNFPPDINPATGRPYTAGNSGSSSGNVNTNNTTPNSVNNPTPNTPINTPVNNLTPNTPINTPSTSGQHVGDGNNLTPIDINKPVVPADIAGGNFPPDINPATGKPYTAGNSGSSSGNVNTNNTTPNSVNNRPLTPNTPVNNPTPNTPVNTPTPNTPVNTPTPNTPVNTPTPNTPVNNPTPNTPVNRPTPNTPIDRPTPNTPVNKPTPNTPSSSTSANSPIPENRPVTLTAAQLAAIAKAESDAKLAEQTRLQAVEEARLAEKARKEAEADALEAADIKLRAEAAANAAAVQAEKDRVAAEQARIKAQADIDAARQIQLAAEQKAAAAQLAEQKAIRDAAAAQTAASQAAAKKAQEDAITQAAIARDAAAQTAAIQAETVRKQNEANAAAAASQKAAAEAEKVKIAADNLAAQKKKEATDASLVSNTANIRSQAAADDLDEANTQVKAVGGVVVTATNTSSSSNTGSDKKSTGSATNEQTGEKPEDDIIIVDQDKDKKSMMSTWTWVLLILIVLIIAGGTTIYFINRKNYSGGVLGGIFR